MVANGVNDNTVSLERAWLKAVVALLVAILITLLSWAWTSLEARVAALEVRMNQGESQRAVIMAQLGDIKALIIKVQDGIERHIDKMQGATRGLP